MDVVAADTQVLMSEHLRIRREVFIDEQQVTEDEELDGLDELDSTLCLVGRIDGQVVAAARLVDMDTDHVHVTRVAVERSRRGQGLGAEMMTGAEAMALSRTTGPLWLVLDAQEHAQGFYEALGYRRTEKERFLEARMWHVEMTKRAR